MKTNLSYYESLPHPSLRQFSDFLHLQDLRPRTRIDYVRQVRRLGSHYSADPATLSEEQVRGYFTHLRAELALGNSALSVTRSAIRLFFLEHLRVKEWRLFEDLRVRRMRSVPLVLSIEEVARLLAAVRLPRMRACLRLIYACGLRVGEAVKLEVNHIDGNLGLLYVRDGKGGRDRTVPLGASMLAELRAFWKTHRHPRWLFPGLGRTPRPAIISNEHWLSQSPSHVSTVALQSAFQQAREAAGLRDQATVHTLRHSYATHLLEAGVSIKAVSSYLGHASLETTAIYLHLTSLSEERTRCALEQLHTRINAAAP